MSFLFYALLSFPKRKLKQQAAVVRCPCRDVASVQHDGILDDRQSESRSAHLAAAAFVDAVETLEDACQVFFRDACPVVSESEQSGVGIIRGRHFDGRTLSGIVDGIVHQVAEDAVQQRMVAPYDDVLRKTVVERHLPSF